jgi:hypothetical protein
METYRSVSDFLLGFAPEQIEAFIFLDFLAISWSLALDVASTYRLANEDETMRIDEATA